jgi:hypothetical protein
MTHTITSLVGHPQKSADVVPLSPFGDSGDPSVNWDVPPTNLRKADSEDSVSNTDLGDWYTWCLIILMCHFGIGIVVIAYLLPHGRDSFYPSIRVY